MRYLGTTIFSNMNKYWYISAVMAPAVCLVSCSDSQESAQATVEDFLEGVAGVVQSSEGDSAEEFIDDLHSYVCGKAPGVVDSLKGLSDSETKAVLRGTVKSEALRELIKRVAQAAIARAVDDKDLIKALVAIGNADDESEAMAAADKVLPHKTRIQIVEIAAAFTKVGIAMGLDDPNVLESALPAVLELAEEYGFKGSDSGKLMRKIDRAF